MFRNINDFQLGERRYIQESTADQGHLARGCWCVTPLSVSKEYCDLNLSPPVFSRQMERQN